MCFVLKLIVILLHKLKLVLRELYWICTSNVHCFVHKVAYGKAINRKSGSYKTI